MPTVQAFILTGHSDGRKARLIAVLTDAVVEAIDAPVDTRRGHGASSSPPDCGAGRAAHSGTQAPDSEPVRAAPAYTL